MDRLTLLNVDITNAKRMSYDEDTQRITLTYDGTAPVTVACEPRAWQAIAENISKGTLGK
jgi:hypothetical protein